MVKKCFYIMLNNLEWAFVWVAEYENDFVIYGLYFYKTGIFFSFTLDKNFEFRLQLEDFKSRESE